MNIDLTDSNLSESEKSEIKRLLQRENKGLSDDLEQMWYLMDLIWEDYGCDNKNLNWENIGKFYSHPVWLLNGLFIEQHDTSMRHRHAISDWIVSKKFKNLVDYGGGFGTLARLIATKDKTIRVAIYEPYPSDFSLRRAGEFENITMISRLENNYDCLLCTDVLEHVEDPLVSFSEMIRSVKLGGELVIANAFYPFEKCHLPENFHLRYSFNMFAKMMGLKLEGQLAGTHAIIFKKIQIKDVNWNKVRMYENVSKLLLPIIETLKFFLRPIKRLILK